MKNSKYTFSANIVNQISAVLIFLTIPNILNEGEYAQTVYISVLLSFMVLSDFGMSFVYSRVMPSIYHSSSNEKIEEFSQTFFWFRIFMSFVGSIVIACIYYYKYENLLNAFLLLFLYPLTVVITFFIQQYSVKEDFLVYRNINIKNSIAKIFIIPMSYFFGISGWLGSQGISSIIVLKTIKEKVIFGFDKFNMNLIKDHFFEAVILLSSFFFWNQLLNSGRLYATIYYNDNVIAQYGIVSAGYLLLLTLVTSIFLPISVATLKIMRENTASAIEQLFSIIIKTAFPIFIIVVLIIELSPFIYEIFFPKYDIDFEILKYQLLSLITLPIIATLGNVFIGMKEPIKLMVIYMVSFGISFIIVNYFEYDIVNPAIAQVCGVTFMGFSLLFSVIIFYGSYIDNKFSKLVQVLSIVVLPYMLYIVIRNYI